MLDLILKLAFKKSWRADVDVNIKVEKEGSQNRFLRNAVSQTANPILLAVIGSKDDISVSDKLHNHSDYVLIWQKSQVACA